MLSIVASGMNHNQKISTINGQNMKLGIVIYCTDVETVWNAFRFGNFILGKEDNVRIFLLAKGRALTF